MSDSPENPDLDGSMDALMAQIAQEVRTGKIKGNARIAALKQVKDYYLAKQKLAKGAKPSGSALARYNDQINGTEIKHGPDATDADTSRTRN